MREVEAYFSMSAVAEYQVAHVKWMPHENGNVMFRLLPNCQ